VQFGPAITLGWLHFVVSLPAELDGMAVAGSVNGACEAIEGEFTAGLIEQDVGARQGRCRSPVSRRSAICPECSCRRCQKLGKPDQIIGRKRQDEDGIHPVAASQLDLGQASGTLDPAEDFFDAFAAALADIVAAVMRGTRVDRRLAPLAGLSQMSINRDMRGNRSISQVMHELRDIVGLIRPQSDPLRAPPPVDHGKRNLSFGGARRLAHPT
jgi:hypothetical protein